MPYSERSPTHVEKIRQHFYGQAQSYKLKFPYGKHCYVIFHIFLLISRKSYIQWHKQLHHAQSFLCCVFHSFIQTELQTFSLPHANFLQSLPCLQEAAKKCVLQRYSLKKGTVRMNELICIKYTKISSIFYYIID